ELDFRSATLVRAEISSAASRLKLRLGPPRARVPIRLDGAVSDVRIVVAEGTCVEVAGEWILNSLSVEGSRRRHFRSRSAATTGCDHAGSEGPRYGVRYELPVSRVSVESEPAAS